MKFSWLSVPIFAAVAFSNVSAFNGRATVVVNYCKSQWYGSQSPDIARLLVVTISNTAVTKTDTILKAGRFYYPTWSFDGTRIAFWRSGHGLSIINADGTNLHDVAQTIDWGSDQEQHLAWPGADGGKWLYYHKPGAGWYRGGTGEIWKVNVDDTTQRVKLCQYKKLPQIQSGDPAGPGLWKWSLSADAKWAVAHTNGTVATMGYATGCIPHAFPPGSDPNTTKPRCLDGGCGYGGCNTGLSASGNIYFHFDGSHTAWYANWWNHTANTMTGRMDIGTGFWGSSDMYKDWQGWLSASDKPYIKGCTVWPRSSGNTDKVFTCLLGWQYGAEYAYCGNNQIVVNWKDHEAAIVTRNPEPPHSQGYVPDGTYYWYAEPGDFHLDGGPAGCYQDTGGKWIPLSQTAIIEPGHAKLPANALSKIDGPVAVYDIAGARIGSFDARTFRTCAAPSLRRGMYVLVSRGMQVRRNAIITNGYLR